MTGQESTPWEAIVEALRERLPIRHTVAALLVCAVLLRLVPFAFWWHLAYAELRLDLWWPMALAGICFYFWLAGQIRHRRIGEPQFFPFSAGFTVILCLCLIFQMIFLAASRWSLVGFYFGLAIMAFGCYWLALALVAYAELWPVFCNSAVATTVSRKLESHKLPAILITEKRKKRWGSPHGLRLVHGHYQDRKRDLLSQIATGNNAVTLLDRVIEAGESVLLYLDVSWAPKVLDEPARLWLELDIARELITICFSIDAEDSRLEIKRWKDYLGQANDPYHQFLLFCFELSAVHQLSLNDVRMKLDRAQGLLKAAHDFRPPDGIEVDFRATMLNTWLALAHHSIPAQAAFDLWLVTSDQNNSMPILLSRNDNPVESDAALGKAKRFLATHYKKWAANNAPGWRDGLAARQDWNSLE